MKKLCTVIYLSTLSFFASANTFVCGDSQSTIMNSSKSNFPYFVVSVFTDSYEVNHKFHAYYQYFKLKCVSDVNDKKYVFIKTNAGGSGSLDNYSLIDTNSGELVITSQSQPITIEERRLGTKTDNFNEVLKVLKRKPDGFTCRLREQTDKEVCLVSAVELG